MPAMNFSTSPAMVAVIVVGMLAATAMVVFAIHLMRANHQRRHGMTEHGHGAHGAHGVFPAFNRVVSILLRLGIPVAILGPMMLLTVRGRTSGQPRTLPVDVHVYDGRRYLIASHGEGNWVYNLRASGEGILSLGRQRERFTAAELPPERGGPIIKEVFARLLASRGVRGSMLRSNLGVRSDAPLDDFIQVAQTHPVFELTASAR